MANKRKLFGFQKKASETLTKSIVNCLDILEQGRNTEQGRNNSRAMTFTSVTGSGKTTMVSDAISKISSRNTLILYFTLSNGGLVRQAVDSINANVGERGVCAEVLTVEKMAEGVPALGSVLVAGWNSLISIDHETGEYKTRISRNETFFKFIKNANIAGRQVISIIDEAHYGNAESASDINSIQSFLSDLDKACRDGGGCNAIRINVTATPTPRLTDIVGEKIQVPLADVVEAGLVRSELEINNPEDINAAKVRFGDSIDGDLIPVLAAAIERDNLRKIMVATNIPVNPLMLVQIPDGKEGERVLYQYKKALIRHGFATEQEIGWYFGEKKNVRLEEVRNPLSPIKVLFYKTALITGWDCPRAQVMVIARKNNSKTSAVQNIGRLMRTNEQKNYTVEDSKDFESLNTIYIFANNDTIDLTVEADSISEMGFDTDRTYLPLTDNPRVLGPLGRMNGVIPMVEQKKRSDPTQAVEATAHVMIESVFRRSNKKKLDLKIPFDGLEAASLSVSAKVADAVDFEVKTINRNDANSVRRSMSTGERKEQIRRVLEAVILECGGVPSYNLLDQVMDRTIEAIRPKEPFKAPKDREIALAAPENKSVIFDFLKECWEPLNLKERTKQASTTATVNLQFRTFRAPSASAYKRNPKYRILDQDIASLQLYREVRSDGEVVAYDPGTLSEPEKVFQRQVATYRSGLDGYAVNAFVKLRDATTPDAPVMVTGYRGDGEERYSNFFHDYLVFMTNLATGKNFAFFSEVKSSRGSNRDSNETLKMKSNCCENYSRNTGVPMGLFQMDSNGQGFTSLNGRETFSDFIKRADREFDPHNNLTFDERQFIMDEDTWINKLAEDPA